MDDWEKEHEEEHVKCLLDIEAAFKNPIDYVVIQTGYTARLMSKAIKNCVYIKDELWKRDGSGDELVGSSLSADQLKRLRDYHKTNELDGTVTFIGVDTFYKFVNTMSVLEKQDYCAFCGMDNVCAFKYADGILLINVDCESG